MSQPGDPVGILDEEAPAEQALQATLPIAQEAGLLVPARARASGDALPLAQQQRPPESMLSDVEGLTRFLMGALILGGDQLLERIRELEQDFRQDPDLLQRGAGLDEETTIALLRYLTIGLFMRGQRTVLKGARSGIYLSLGTASWFLDKMNGVTDNRLTRSIRRPIASRLRRWGQATSQVIREGRLEEQHSRQLAMATTGEIIDDLLDFVAKNPELSEFIRELVGQQSVGLAGVVAGSARQLSVTADDTAEGIVRRLLGRKPRKALPPSPLVGKPQTMYAAGAQEWETDRRDE